LVKYLIFDFDGTIADSKKAFVLSWNKLAKDYNFKEMKLDELDEMKKLSMKERSSYLNFKMNLIPIVIPKFYKLYKESIHDVELFEGIQDLILGLQKRGYELGIISSNSKENILTFLSKNKLKNIADKNILCSNRIFSKDKQIKKFLKNHNLTPSEIIYVGDEKRDIIACKKVGVKIIWVDWGYDSIEVVEDSNPDFQVYSPEEILDIV
jgi:phosphoglycolate phosphatase